MLQLVAHAMPPPTYYISIYMYNFKSVSSLKIKTCLKYMFGTENLELESEIAFEFECCLKLFGVLETLLCVLVLSCIKS